MVEPLFLEVPRGFLRFVIVVFSDHTHLLFLFQTKFKNFEKCQLILINKLRIRIRLAPVLKTIFHQCVISYTCSQSYSDGSVLRTGSTRTLPTNFLVGN